VCAPRGDFSHVTRQANDFEAVMAYFHIDRTQAYVQSLGFDNVANRQVLVKADDFPDDNSYYDAHTKELSFGEGGTDDGEDGDVIVHEYGHAVQDSQIPGFGTSDDAGAIGEGFADYLAAAMDATYARAHDPFDACFAEWDALGLARPLTCLRRVDTDMSVEKARADAVCAVDIHCVGQAWSSALWTIRGAIGGRDADRLVLQSNFALTPSASFDDAGRVLLAADRQLYGGTHRDVLVSTLAAHGIIGKEHLDDTPGDAEPLAVPGSVSGTVDAASDQHDVYRLALTAGSGVIVRLTGDSGELEVRLLPPGTLTLDEASAVAGSARPGANDSFEHVAAQSGEYYLDVSATSGGGSYVLQTLADGDADTRADGADNCPATPNARQQDRDDDERGDACDPFPADPLDDADHDGHGADSDNCPGVPNPGQADWDRDGKGDACDASARAALGRVVVVGRRLIAYGRLAPGSLPARAWHLVVERRACRGSRCRYRPATEAVAASRGGRVRVVLHRLPPGRYRVRAVVRAAGRQPGASRWRIVLIRR
jgi:hypothetical protein